MIVSLDLRHSVGTPIIRGHARSTVTAIIAHGNWQKNPIGSAYQYDLANGRHHTVKISHNDRNQHPRLPTLKNVIFVTAPCVKFPSIVNAAELTWFEIDVRTIGEVSGAESYHSRKRQLRRSVTSSTPHFTVYQSAYAAHSKDRSARSRVFSKILRATSKFQTPEGWHEVSTGLRAQNSLS